MKSASLIDVWGEHQTGLSKNDIRSNAADKFTNSNAFEALTEQQAPFSFSRNLLDIERTPNETISNDTFVPKSVYSEEKGTVHAFHKSGVEAFEYGKEFTDRLGRSRRMKLSVIPPGNKQYSKIENNEQIARLQGLSGIYDKKQYGLKQEVIGIIHKPEVSAVTQAEEVKQRSQMSIKKDIYMNRTGVQEFPTFDSGRTIYNGENPTRIPIKLMNQGHRFDSSVENNTVDSSTNNVSANISHVKTKRYENGAAFSRKNNGFSHIPSQSVQNVEIKAKTNRNRSDEFLKFPVMSTANVHVHGKHQTKDISNTHNIIVERMGNMMSNEQHSYLKAEVPLNPNSNDKRRETMHNSESSNNFSTVRSNVVLNPNLNNTAHVYKPTATADESITKRIRDAVTIGDKDDEEVQHIMQGESTIDGNVVNTAGYLSNVDAVAVDLHRKNEYSLSTRKIDEQITLKPENSTTHPLVSTQKLEGELVKSDVYMSNRDDVAQDTYINGSQINDLRKHDAMVPLSSKDVRKFNQETLNPSTTNSQDRSDYGQVNSLSSRVDTSVDRGLTGADSVPQVEVRADVTKRYTTRDSEVDTQGNGVFLPIGGGDIRGALEASNCTSGTMLIDRLDTFRSGNSRLEERVTPSLSTHNDRTVMTPRLNSGMSQIDARHTPIVSVNTLRG